jgi:AraC-like DNA-binding protein
VSPDARAPGIPDESHLGPRATPKWTSVLAPVAAGIFPELNVSASLYEPNAQEWYPIHLVPNVARFEYQLGVADARYRHNAHAFARVLETREAYVGTHAGFSDLFVPVGDANEVWGILTVGPFSTSRPTSGELRERWHAFTLEPAHLSDPVFAEYVDATLATLTLDATLLPKFESFLRCFSNLLAGEGDPRENAAEASIARVALQEARFTERMAGAVRAMLEARTPAAWVGHQHETLTWAGLSHFPEHVVVGLLTSQAADADALDELIRRDAFQHAATRMARKFGGAIAARTGERGVVFLVDARGPAARARTRLVELADRARHLARRFGLKLSAGVSRPASDETLSARYFGALQAAERALSQGQNLATAEPQPESSRQRMRKLREELSKNAVEEPKLLPLRFERYVEFVLSHAGYRLERVCSELDIALSMLIDPLVAADVLDEPTIDAIWARLEKDSRAADTVSVATEAYRRAVAEIAGLLAAPKAARKEQGVRRALEFIQQHLTEPLDLPEVARVAGFSPAYFSKLFKRDQGIPFERYLLGLRLQRSKQLLLDTSLSLERVRKVAGFRTKSAFFRAFQASVGMTPKAFRVQGPRLSIGPLS